jgi:hypothetical protein
LESCEAVFAGDAWSGLAATIERKTAQQTRVLMARVAYARKPLIGENRRYHSLTPMMSDMAIYRQSTMSAF